MVERLPESALKQAKRYSGERDNVIRVTVLAHPEVLQEALIRRALQQGQKKKQKKEVWVQAWNTWLNR